MVAFERTRQVFLRVSAEFRRFASLYRQARFEFFQAWIPRPCERGHGSGGTLLRHVLANVVTGTSDMPPWHAATVRGFSHNPDKMGTGRRKATKAPRWRSGPRVLTNAAARGGTFWRTSLRRRAPRWRSRPCVLTGTATRARHVLANVVTCSRKRRQGRSGELRQVGTGVATQEGVPVRPSA
jgi:hypothetical protein